MALKPETIIMRANIMRLVVIVYGSYVLHSFPLITRPVCTLPAIDSTALTTTQWVGTTGTPLFTTGTQLVTTGTPLVTAGLASRHWVTMGSPRVLLEHPGETYYNVDEILVATGIPLETPLENHMKS
jgi:hypothetical protein